MCTVAASVVLVFSMAFEARLEAELARFPAREVTNAWIEFNHHHLRWISACLTQSQDRISEVYYSDWLMEAVQSQIPWTLLQNAQDRTLGIKSRNSSLIKLHRALGDEDFIQGIMPPAVPLSRFREGKPPLGTLAAPARNKTGMAIVSNPEPQ
jgi:hypothetical protein